MNIISCLLNGRYHSLQFWIDFSCLKYFPHRLDEQIVLTIQKDTLGFRAKLPLFPLHLSLISTLFNNLTSSCLLLSMFSDDLLIFTSSIAFTWAPNSCTIRRLLTRLYAGEVIQLLPVFIFWCLVSWKLWIVMFGLCVAPWYLVYLVLNRNY